MAVKRILIAVKTYPTISKRYDELVCTAGFLADGTWIRLYPIPFRKLDYINQYKKYDWIEIDMEKNSRDFRPESYRPASKDTIIKVVGNIETKNNWQERKQIVLKNVYCNISDLIKEAKDKNTQKSLAVFKPTKILDFLYEEVPREWDRGKLEALNQMKLFEKRDGDFKIVRKLPYKFSYKFEDNTGKARILMIEDWETGALFWNCIKKYNDEKIACQKVKEKYLDDFAVKKDLHFFLGTTQQYHHVYPNPFIIIGTFHPKLEEQNLFDNYV
ncbi:MAG: hypothetical protein KKG93_20450 [Bacteroidetes bacterium]|nr:hypothetical protein [Bacteroidota bacterium]